MPTFTAKVFQNPYLPRGAEEVHAIVSLAAHEPEGLARAGGPLAFGLLLDASGSMGDDGGERLRHAKAAVIEAIQQLREDCLFFLVAGRDRAETLALPQRATAEHRAAAIEAVRQLDSGGGTRMSHWLRLALQHFESLHAAHGPGLICQSLLLTDGKNDEKDDLPAALRHCAGVFECHARGVGVDWRVDELRLIAQRLLGTVDIIPQPEQMSADFRAILGHALDRSVADVRLRLWTPQGATVTFCRQVAPEILDLAPLPGSNPQVRDYPTGAWNGREARDFHFAIRVKPGQLGQRMLAGRASVVLGDAPDAPRLAEAQVLAVWTDDEERTAVIDRTVAHYTGQGELAEAIQEGLAARQAGREDVATRKLGRAVQLAAALGNEGTTRLLRRVVEIVDEREGTVRLRREVDEADAMALETRSTRTRRVA